MFQSERMKKVNVLTLERDIDTLMMGLGTLQAIHLTPPAKDSEGRLLSRYDGAEELGRLRDLEGRVEHLAAVLKVSLDTAPPEVPERFAVPGEVLATLNRLEPDIEQTLAAQQTLREEAADLRRIAQQVEGFEGTALSPAHLREFSFVHFALGSIPEGRLKKVQSAVEDRVLLVPFADVAGRRKVLAITSKKGRWALDSTLQEHGFQPEEVKEELPGLPDEVLTRVHKRLAEVLAEDEELEEHLAAVARDEEARLRRFWRQLRVRRKIVHAQENLGRTRSTYLVSGWVPEHLLETFINKVLTLTEHRALVEIRSPEELPADDEPPSSLRHSWLGRPFALLVSGYGYPRYREIEPTVFVAISFLAMFGAMFGDVGQGAVLVLAGLAVFRWAAKPTQRDFGLLIALCGVSAVVFGFVYGSVFGKEELVEPLWGGPRKNVLAMLQLSIAVGIFLISVGVILNIVNKVRTGDWAAALFDRFGLAGIAFYWGALGLGVRYVLSREFNPGLTAVVILVPLVLIFLREPVRFALAHGGRKRGAKPADAAETGEVGGPVGFFVATIDGLVEVLEALLMYLANTASFMRLAAYAISHAGLCLVIFALGDAVAKSAGGLIWTTLLVVFGNAVVIVLEGLVVAVQTMRLEYYEFFGKFFTGEGQAYKPFDLRSEES